MNQGWWALKIRREEEHRAAVAVEAARMAERLASEREQAAQREAKQALAEQVALRREVDALRGQVSSLTIAKASLRLQLALRSYDPSQPREPAGSPDGGQWTSGEGGGGEPPSVTDDPDPASPIQSVARTRRADGSLAEEDVLLRDGSRVASQFSPSDAPGLDERHRVTLPDGTQTTFELEGRNQTIRDADGQVISRHTWTDQGPVPDATVQPAHAPLAYGAAAAAAAKMAQTLRAGGTLFTAMSMTNGPDSQAVAAVNISEFTKLPESVTFVGKLTDEEANRACPARPLVQQATDLAAKEVREELAREGRTLSPAQLGTAIHKRVATKINAPSDGTIPGLPRENLVAEVSFLKGRLENYGVPGTIRVDNFEGAPDFTACIGDLKTGKSPLTPPRIAEMALKAGELFGKVRRLIIYEDRPRNMP